MSDSFTNRIFSGKFGSLREPPEESQRKRLVEECEVVSVHGVQEAFGKKALINGIRDCRPLCLPVLGGHFDVWLIEDPHRLPGRIERWSSLDAGTSRLWFFCPGCRGKVAKLFYYYLAPGSSARSELLCRECHHLTYLCVNSGGNGWYREVARPMKQLLREKQNLLAKQNRPRVSARLAQIDDEVAKLRQLVKAPSKPGTKNVRYGLAGRKRRLYRNLALLEQ